MLTWRSGDGRFDCAVWRWTGEAIDVLATVISPPPAVPVFYEAISVPHVMGRTPRAKARSIDELEAIAEERGVGGLVRHLVHVARASGFSVHTGLWTIRLKRKIGDYDQPQTVMGAYLDTSSSGELNTGCWRELIGIDECDLPGTPATGSRGFLNTNRVVRTIGEVDVLVSLFAPPRKKSGSE